MRWHRWLLVSLATAAVVAAVAVFVWCIAWYDAVTTDATQPADLVLAARPGDGWLMGGLSGISIWVTGEIEGEALVGFEGQSRRVAGRVDLEMGGDWFQPTCDFHYRPQGVTAGKLVVRYDFR